MATISEAATEFLSHRRVAVTGVSRTPSAIPLLGLDGPRNELPFGWDILVVALFSLAVYALAIRSRLPAERALEYVGDLTAEAEPDGDL